MSDNQRRHVCRILFIMMCVVPTSIVAYRICHPPSPAYWQQLVQSQLGIKTSVDSVETPSPSVTILRGLEFIDPELGPLLSATEVQIFHGDTQHIQIPHSLRTTNAGLIRLIKSIDERLIRGHEADRPWRIDFLNQVTLEESIHSQRTGSEFPETLVVENLQIDVVPEVDGTRTKLQFQVPALDDQQWVVCSLGRSHGSENQISQQRFEINTNDIELPCWLLGGIVPEIQRLGPHCRFAGVVDVNPQAGHPYGWFTGRFSRIDAPAGLDQQLNQRLTQNSQRSGTQYSAVVKLCKLDGGIEQLEADLIRPDGTFSPIERTIEVIQQFDIAGAIESAAKNPNRYARAPNTMLQ